MHICYVTWKGRTKCLQAEIRARLTEFEDVCLGIPNVVWEGTRMAMYLYCNIEACSSNHCGNGKTMSITYSESVCSLRFPARNAHAPYCPLCSAMLYNIFPHYLINGTIFGKKVIEHKMCLLISFTAFI